MRHVNRGLVTTALAALALSTPAAAQAPSAPPQSPPPPPAAAAPPPIESWDALVDSLSKLAPAMLARLPESMRDDPQIRQEVGRLMVEAVASRALEAISGDGDHPWFVPTIGLTLNIFQPNADTIYKSATITPGGVYRLRGRRGSVRIAKIGEYSDDPAENSVAAGVHFSTFGYHDINTLNVDANGVYSVILSPTRPSGYTGDWWRLDPRTKLLALRQVASDWATERDPTISIERLDAPVMRPRPSAAELEARLERLAKTAANAALAFVDHVQMLRDQGYVNKLKVFDVSQMGALVGQFYYEGSYELKDDEALIVEANESSLNDSQSRVDKDGVLRMVVSAKDPGVPNWLDTTGYPVGVIQGRWTNCSAQPVPSVRKVKLADVRAALPADTPVVTPAQRDTIVRERRAELQQRQLW
jgi:hypothetical protein